MSMGTEPKWKWKRVDHGSNALPLSPWPIADDSGAEASEAWHAANPTPASRPRRLTWAEWKVVIDSGWRAGKKQLKKRATELRAQPRSMK